MRLRTQNSPDWCFLIANILKPEEETEKWSKHRNYWNRSKFWRLFFNHVSDIRQLSLASCSCRFMRKFSCRSNGDPQSKVSSHAVFPSSKLGLEWPFLPDHGRCFPRRRPMDGEMDIWDALVFGGSVSNKDVLPIHHFPPVRRVIRQVRLYKFGLIKSILCQGLQLNCFIPKVWPSNLLSFWR